MRINDDNRDDDKIAEQRETARKDQQRKQAQKPVATFEAKLSEKTTHDHAMQNSDVHRTFVLKEAKKEKLSIIDKLIQETKPKEAEERKRPATTTVKPKTEKKTDFETEAEELRRKSGEAEPDETDNVDRSGEDAEVDESEESTGHEKTSEKEGEVSSEGHKRVAEKQEGGSGEGGTGGGGGGQSQGESFGSQQGFGSGGGDSDERRDDKSAYGAVAHAASMQTAGALAGRFSGGGSFQQKSRPFKSENLDGIVSKVQVGLNENQEEFFSVDLNDAYFEGLKVQALKTPQGVVLKFVCPNLAVRSTFIRERPKLYEHLRAKNVSVFRIDIV